MFVEEKLFFSDKDKLFQGLATLVVRMGWG